MPEEPESERLLDAQTRRADQEAELAESSEIDEERLLHERRGDKAEYLREQLERRAESETDA